MTKHGEWYWHELMTTDPRTASEFYKTLLGWGVKEMPMGGPEPYRLWTMPGAAPDQSHGGMMKIGPEMGGAPSHWMVYVKVDNVDDAAKRVPQLGGKILVPPTDVPGVGRFVIVQDPTGAAISLMTPVAR